jgi:hypothetical protein
MDKENVVYVYNGILLSYTKEDNPVIWYSIDEQYKKNPITEGQILHDPFYIR